MVRKLLQAAAMVAVLTAPASAQFMPSLPLNAPDKPPPTPEEIEKQKAIDNAYKSVTKKIPDKKAPTDPWGGIRTPPTASGNKP